MALAIAVMDEGSKYMKLTKGKYTLEAFKKFNSNWLLTLLAVSD